MNDVAVEELSARAMIDEVIAEVQLEFSKKSAEERAFILIRGFFDAADRKWDEGEVIPDNVSASFHAWFNDPRNRQAKMRALKRVIEIERERTQKYKVFD